MCILHSDVVRALSHGVDPYHVEQHRSTIGHDRRAPVMAEIVDGHDHLHLSR